MYKLIFSSFLLLAACRLNEPKADAYGNFEADEIMIGAEATGKILQFTAQEGQILRAGEQVGLIDTVQLQLRREQLLASVKAVAAKSPAIQQQLAVFERQMSSVRQQISTLEREKRRVENLIKSDAATPKQLDDLVAQIDAANRQIDVLTEQKSASNAALSTQKFGLLAEILPLQKQISQIDDQLAKCKIASPSDGTILTTYANAGEIAAAGKALFKMADLSTLMLRAYISGDQLTGIKTGQKVKVTVDGPEGAPKEFAGTVQWISPKAEFTPKVIQTRDERVNLVYAVKIAVPNPEGALKIGMPAEMWIKTE